jgi:hypothetical protein
MAVAHAKYRHPITVESRDGISSRPEWLRGYWNVGGDEGK